MVCQPPRPTPAAQLAGSEKAKQTCSSVSLPVAEHGADEGEEECGGLWWVLAHGGGAALGQEFASWPGSGSVFGGGGGSPSPVFLAEDHQQRLAEGCQPVGERALLQVVACCPRCRGECVVGDATQIVDDLLADLVAGAAEPVAGSLTDQAVGPQPPQQLPDDGDRDELGWGPLGVVATRRGAGVDTRPRSNQVRSLRGGRR